MAQTLHDYLAGRRRLRDISATALAAKLDVSRQALRSWETGATSPTIEQVRRWISALELDEGETVQAATLAVMA